jgi:hypothetical protein
VAARYPKPDSDGNYPAVYSTVAEFQRAVNDGFLTQPEPGLFDAVQVMRVFPGPDQIPAEAAEPNAAHAKEQELPPGKTSAAATPAPDQTTDGSENPVTSVTGEDKGELKPAETPDLINEVTLKTVRPFDCKDLARIREGIELFRTGKARTANNAAAIIAKRDNPGDERGANALRDRLGRHIRQVLKALNPHS